ncbi:MAG: glutamate-5-semialdehyde dehydrogenase [Lachnospiraceae bacterium]|nr:glutamate-5-semialdehyde dehydrogenase [Lachnospiraceae bacterium]
MSYVEELGKKALIAKNDIVNASTDEKNNILEKIAVKLLERSKEIIEVNEVEYKAAAENGTTGPMLDRLKLNRERIEGIADACRYLQGLEDPVGEIVSGSKRPNGMKITKIRVPMGVIGIIYESRPNVTVDAATLCIKSGNATILRGGKEVIKTNTVLMNIMRDAIAECGYNPDIVQLITETSHEISTELMKANDYLDLLIPRGSARLINAVVQNATVPVIETGTGNCHIYIDETADLEMGVNITDNGKTQRPGVCNALETCLVNENVAKEFLPMLKARLDEHNVEIRGCEKTKEILGDCVVPATEEDYATEFLDYIISIKVVKDVNEAVTHISKFSSGHSECIITNNYKNATTFKAGVDSACVYVNCSTRFTDGGEFGLGAEIGISTQKLHARGPMGLKELTTTKYIIEGEGQVR